MTKTKETLPTKPQDFEEVVQFTEDFKLEKNRDLITFCADSYNKWIQDVFPFADGMSPMTATEAKNGGGLQVGNYIFYLRPMPMYRWGSRWEGLRFGGVMSSQDEDLIVKREKLELYRSGRLNCHCAFDAEINIPILATKDKYDNNLSVWMSLTPNEVLTQRSQVKRAKGNVGMAGLGLGWAARRVLERKKVDHLTVVERDLDVIKTFGNPLKEEFGDKLTLVCGDAYYEDWMPYDVSLWDIWADYGGVAWDRKFEEISKNLELAGKACVYWGTRTIRN